MYLWAYPALANISERQLQKALMTQVKETATQQLEAIKAFFLQKKDTFAVLPTVHGKSFTISQAGF